MDIKNIRQAVLANRAGLQDATEQQIMTIWRSLDEQTQKQYLESVKERKAKDAVSNASKRNI